MTTIQVPDKYGYVILSSVVLQVVTSGIMGGKVMDARKRLDVGYPNLYATPGVHKHAEEFNRIQRGHQNMFEAITTFTASALIGGLKYPIAVSVFGVLFAVGNVLYQVGYSDMALPVETARYKKGGMLRIVGLLGTMGSAIGFAGSLNNWW